MDTAKLKKIYMIGIKGVGMSMLAQFFSGKGIEVSGSDIGEKFMTDEALKRADIKIIEEFNEDNIPSDVDLIIYSTAYNSENNVEVKKALAGKIKTLTYAEALGTVFNQQYGVAVVGSHGKTTTTAWLGFVLNRAGLEPNVMVGSNVPQFNGSVLLGESDRMIIEADEYQNKLANFNPRGVFLNNIDYDHPDFFKTRADYENVFIEFIKRIPKKGFLIANRDDEIIKKIASVNSKSRVIFYGIKEDADFIAYDIKSKNNLQYFKVKMKDEDGFSELGEFSIKLLGEHNIYNALAVIAGAIEFDIDLVEIRKYLEEFAGTSRRAEVLGIFNGAIIIDDYAHHPTEIKTTIDGIKKNYKDKNIRVIFHPHTFTRTRELFDDFVKSFSGADEVVVLDIYGSAREAQGGVHSRDLVEKIKLDKNINAKYIGTLKEAEEYLRKTISKKDLILLMGAGDVFRIGENLVK